MKYRKQVLEFLEKNRLMSLATSSKNKPWATTVFFAYDNACNIYFFSAPNTKHGMHIARNPYVAVTFNQYTGKPNLIRGLQIAGRAMKIPTKNMQKSYVLYRKRFPWADEFKSNHVLYIIHPKEIHYLDQALFGHFYRIEAR